MKKLINQEMSNSKLPLDNLINDLAKFEEFNDYDFSKISKIKIKSQVEKMVNCYYK